MPTIAEKRQAFRRRHDSGCFVIPNPWDVGSARYLQHLGFEALATTSAGVAYTLGLPDGAVSRAGMLAHIRSIVEAVDVPVNADFESGYAPTPEGVAESVRLCVATGVAGLSIEDGSGDPARPLYELAHAVERFQAARAAAGPEVVLTGRAECFTVGQLDLDDALRRVRAYAEAGADCLYVPGITTREQIAAVVEAVTPKPVNVLMARAGFGVPELAAMGVRRISVGSGLARAAWGGFLRAAREIAEAGRFDALADAVPYAKLNAFFRDDRVRRSS